MASVPPPSPPRLPLSPLPSSPLAPVSALKARALRLLAAREHSRAELERRLAAFEQAPGELARVLDELQAKGFIDEQRVLESVLHRRAARLGTARIHQELRDKGLAPEAVGQAVAGLLASELTRAREVWRKKFGQLPPSPDAAARMRQTHREMRFLAARGFSAEVVRRVVVGAADAEDEAAG